MLLGHVAQSSVATCRRGSRSSERWPRWSSRRPRELARCPSPTPGTARPRTRSRSGWRAARWPPDCRASCRSWARWSSPRCTNLRPGRPGRRGLLPDAGGGVEQAALPGLPAAPRAPAAVVHRPGDPGPPGATWRRGVDPLPDETHVGQLDRRRADPRRAIPRALPVAPGRGARRSSGRRARGRAARRPGQRPRRRAPLVGARHDRSPRPAQRPREQHPLRRGALLVAVTCPAEACAASSDRHAAAARPRARAAPAREAASCSGRVRR